VQIHILPGGPIPTNAFLLTAPERGEAVLIDAPGEIWAKVEPLLAAAKCRLTELWITHGHWDHTQGGAEIVRATGAKVRAHAADRVLIENPNVMRAFGLEIEMEPLKVDAWVEPGEKLSAIGTTAEVRWVPGHCPGNVLFYFPAEGVAFVGDALFKGSVGRTDLPGGDQATLFRAIRSQIYSLPDRTIVHAGHGPPTTVGEEKQTNPYVRAE
jgi:glyoxylase-like metal-dependent hydrolase (beta-lactamase superfamily II)